MWAGRWLPATAAYADRAERCDGVPFSGTGLASMHPTGGPWCLVMAWRRGQGSPCPFPRVPQSECPMPVTAALNAWREAERLWEGADRSDADAVGRAARDVIAAWMRYEAISGSSAILVANAEGTLVAANEAAGDLVGLSVEDLIGQTTRDITASEDEGGVGDMWQDFLVRGMMSGSYRLRRGEGTVEVTYEARAHHPIPGYFSSRLRPATTGGVSDDRSR